jgi:hypothetical protein
MRKSIKVTLLSTLLIGGSYFAYAKAKAGPGEVWRCLSGSTAHCSYAPWDYGYDCTTPPSPVTWGDCSGMVKVVEIE